MLNLLSVKPKAHQFYYFFNKEEKEMNKIFYSLVLALVLTGCGGGTTTTINNNTGENSSSDTSNDTASNNGNGDNGNTTKPGTEQPPKEEPPKETPPKEQPPVEQPPVETPPKEQPPKETPPVETPPKEQPPVEQPPVETPPVEQPPKEEPPKPVYGSEENPLGLRPDLEDEYSHIGKPIVGSLPVQSKYGRPGEYSDICFDGSGGTCNNVVPSEYVVELHGTWLIKDKVTLKPKLGNYLNDKFTVLYRRTVVSFSKFHNKGNKIYRMTMRVIGDKRVNPNANFSPIPANQYGEKDGVIYYGFGNYAEFRNTVLSRLTINGNDIIRSNVVGLSPDGSKIYSNHIEGGDYADGIEYGERTIEKVSDAYDPYNFFKDR